MQRMTAILFAFILIVLGAGKVAAHYTYILPADFSVSSGETTAGRIP